MRSGLSEAGPLIRPSCPYLTGGVGVYNSSSGTSAYSTSSNSVTNFGLNGGAGLSLALTGIAVYAEGTYHYVFTEGDRLTMVPVVVGIRLGGI